MLGLQSQGNRVRTRRSSSLIFTKSREGTATEQPSQFEPIRSLALRSTLRPQNLFSHKLASRQIQWGPTMEERLLVAERLLGRLLREPDNPILGQESRQRSSQHRSRRELLRRTITIQCRYRQSSPAHNNRG